MLKALCHRLMAIPLSLEHGDLHCYNIAVTPTGCVVFDWTDGCLSHPFFSMATLLEKLEREEDPVAVDPAIPGLIRRAYLEHWTAYDPPDRLAEALRIAEVLGALHQVYTYLRIILPAVENKAEWAPMAPYWMRRVLGGVTPWIQR